MPIASVGPDCCAMVLASACASSTRAALGNHAVDETEMLGLRGAVESAGHRHLHRPLARDRAADRHQRGRAEQAEVHARQAEAGFLARDRKIAGGDELAAGRGGDALDRRDDRLRQRDDGLHESRAAREQLHVIAAAPVAVVPVRLHFLEVMAGAERRSDAREHNDARLIVARDRVELER